MKKHKQIVPFLIFFFGIIILFFVPSNLSAQDYKQNFRLNFFSLLWQRLSLNYEYELKNKHGFNGNFTYAFGGDRTGVLGGINYRYYLSDARSSFFIGGIANYSAFVERIQATIDNPNTGTLPSLQDYRFKPQAVLGALQAGFRWNILRIFNVHGRLGYGVPFMIANPYQDTSNNNTQPIQTDKNFVEQRFKLFSSWEGEISFGIRF